MDSAYTHLMIFAGDTLADPGRRRRGLAVEPMTSAPDMLHNGWGRIVLEEDEEFEATRGWLRPRVADGTPLRITKGLSDAGTLQSRMAQGRNEHVVQSGP